MRYKYIYREMYLDRTSDNYLTNITDFTNKLGEGGWKVHTLKIESVEASVLNKITVLFEGAYHSNE